MQEWDPLRAPGAPWSLRLFARAGVSPLWVGLGLSAAWLLFYLACTLLAGDEPGRFSRSRFSSWPMEAAWALLIGMPPAVMALSLRAAVRDVRDLAPALRAAPDEIEALERQVTTLPRGWLRAVGLGAVVGTLAVMARDPHYWIDDVLPPPYDPAYLWLLGRNILNWWLITRALTAELAVARAFSALGQRLADVDPLDRAPLAPFGRHGLRSVLLWMLLIALFAPIYILGAAEPVLGLSLAAVLGVAALAFLVPVWGARQQLRTAKAAELSRVREALRAQREGLLDAASPAWRDGRLADLLTWEARVAAASEWPFGRTTVVRFVLYTAIGLGSWLGAATVERLLGWLLG